MKRYLMILAACAMLSSLGWAQADGAALYKAKCAGCHGPMGEGKIGPSLQKTSLTQQQIAALLTNGAASRKAPHAKGMATLTPDQVNAISTFVVSLKK